MTSKIIKNDLCAEILVSALSMSRIGLSLNAQQSITSAADALQKARVLGRLAEAMPALSTRAGGSKKAAIDATPL